MQEQEPPAFGDGPSAPASQPLKSSAVSPRRTAQAGDGRVAPAGQAGAVVPSRQALSGCAHPAQCVPSVVLTRCVADLRTAQWGTPPHQNLSRARKRRLLKLLRPRQPRYVRSAVSVRGLKYVLMLAWQASADAPCSAKTLLAAIGSKRRALHAERKA